MIDAANKAIVANEANKSDKAIVINEAIEANKASVVNKVGVTNKMDELPLDGSTMSSSISLSYISGSGCSSFTPS